MTAKTQATPTLGHNAAIDRRRVLPRSRVSIVRHIGGVTIPVGLERQASNVAKYIQTRIDCFSPFCRYRIIDSMLAARKRPQRRSLVPDAQATVSTCTGCTAKIAAPINDAH